MHTAVTQCRFLLSLGERLTGDLDDGHLALEPKPGVKTAGWLIGHLAVTGDFGRKLCGRTPLCPREWRALFNPGSQILHESADYPPMRALVDAFRAVYSDLPVAASAVTPATLAATNPVGFTRSDFPTVGEFVAYLLSGHLAYHLGQLGAWRAAVGRGSPREDAWTTARRPNEGDHA